MLNLINQIVARAKADRQRIVLPEGTEERTLKAANQILTDEVADLILLGKPAEINELAVKWGLGNISKATIIDPETTIEQRIICQLTSFLNSHPLLLTKLTQQLCILFVFRRSFRIDNSSFADVAQPPFYSKFVNFSGFTQ